MKKMLCIFLLLALAVQLGACGAKPATVGKTANLTADLVAAQPQELATIDYDANAITAEFAVSLLQNSYNGDDDNLILSPYSVLTALAMVANGADGATLAQMEQVFGMSSEELNTVLYLFRQNGKPELSAANSVWVRDDYAAEIRPEFLQANTDYFGAQIYRAPFNGQTVEDVNHWVRQQTKDRIDELVEDLDANTVMLLLNALSFDGKWVSPFKADDSFTGTFYAADGEPESVEMMSDTVVGYLNDGFATGFVKDYENGYSFVALLPNEGVSMEDYMASLSGAGFLQTIENMTEESVRITMPKLETDTDLTLGNMLSAMGMPDAFTRQANFSRIDGTKDLYISQVLHKTYLKIDEEGTEAAAATSVAVDTKSAPIHFGPIVDLNRPYVMAIMDKESGMILFMGIVNEID